MAKIEQFSTWFNSEYVCNYASFVEKASKDFSDESNIDGWAACGLMKILNFAIGNHLEPNEIYLEIGTYAGRSLIAGLKNNNAVAHVIDNFWDSDKLKTTFQENINRFKVNDRVVLHEVDAENFDIQLPKVGILLYDANHDRGYTHFNLQKFTKYLSDESIIIVDDINIVAGVGHKCKDGYHMHSQYPVYDDVNQWFHENRHCVTFVGFTPWTFGQAIFHYKRKL